MQDFLFGLFGDTLVPYLLMAALPLVFILLFALVTILGELKVSAFMQHRVGPMEAGPYGILQPLADVLKLMQKEALRPAGAIRWLFQLAPFLVFIGSFAAFAVIPFSPFYIAADLNVGVFYILAVSAIVVIGIFMAGWASNNKYSLFGGVRSVAQIISYEIPAGFVILGVVMMAGTLSMQGIIEQQGGGFWNWYILGGPKDLTVSSVIADGPVYVGGTWLNIILAPLMLLVALIYYVCGLAETNRVPFDLPEAESELVSGYNTEYSSMKYAIFYLAEYANMFVVCAIAVTLFLGGWHSPLPRFVVQYFGVEHRLWIGAEGLVWFVLKAMLLVLVQILLRWTLPRLRVDQLMHLCWKVFLPVGFAMVMIIGGWMTFVAPRPPAKEHGAREMIPFVDDSTAVVPGTGDSSKADGTAEDAPINNR